MNIRFLFTIIIGLVLVSCNPFGDSSDGFVDSQFGSENGAADSEESDSPDSGSNQETAPTATPTRTPTPTPIPVDQIDDDNTILGFGGGDHTGTVFSNGVLTLNTTTNNAELDESWTPKWDNLVSYWKLNESSWNGTANEVQDSKGTSHGVRSGDATTTSSAKLGDYAGVFDGSGDFVTIGSVPAVNRESYSISLWFKTTTSADQKIISFSWQHHPIQVLSRVLRVCIWPTCVLGTRRINDDNWNHVVVVGNGVDHRIYLNGVAEPEVTVADGTTGSLGTSFAIGAIPPGGALSFLGSVDDVALWNTPLTTDDIALIYSRQSAKYAGQMQSRIMNSRSASSSWENLDWSTTLPFGKELPDGGGSSNSESLSDYSGLFSNTLMNDLAGLWHMNGSVGALADDASLSDDSGQSKDAVAKDADAVNTIALRDGLFGQAIQFDGVNDHIRIPLVSTQTTDISFSVWVNWMKGDRNELGIIFYNGDTSFNGYGLLIGNGGCGTGNLLNVIIGSKDCDALDGSTEIPINVWKHIVVTSSANNWNLYVDGVLRETGTGTPNVPAGDAVVGSATTLSGLLTGQVDELAFWNRALDPSEIVELYRRGANRVKFQVRTCSSSNCSDQDALTGDGWQGPGGNYLTYFSELYNNSSVTSSCSIPQQCYLGELTLAGDVQIGSPSVIFNQFGSDGISVDNN